MIVLQKTGTLFRLLAGIPLAAIVASGAGGCRFIAPDIKEQQELANRGAFANGTPAWVPTSNKGVSSAGRSSTGFLPDSYSAELSGTSVSPVYAAMTNDTKAQWAEEQKAETVRKAAEPKQGPLDRIAKACPGTEAEVNEALTTVEAPARLEKYSALTRTCSASTDLWIWNGKEFLSSGKLTDAARCFDQALNIDPQNMEAAGLLAEVRKQQNKAAAEKMPANKK